jgi:hypothetical protein
MRYALRGSLTCPAVAPANPALVAIGHLLVLLSSATRSLEMSHTEDPVRVVIATDSFLIGDGLACLFADVDYIDVIGRARNHDEILKLVDELAPEALIISIRTPVVTTMATIAVARSLRVAWQFQKKHLRDEESRISSAPRQLHRGYLQS